MKRFSPKYGRSINTAHTTARHSLLVVAGFYSAMAGVREQYPIGHAVLSSGFCRSTQPTWDSQASISTVYRPAMVVSASIGWFVNRVFRFSSAIVSALVRD